MSTGLWKRPGVPHKGWSCVNVEDLEEPSATCQMCQVQVIRYVHFMSHPDYASVLEVGCVCAENMEDDYVGPRRREAALKSASGRRKRWLTRKWKRSERGNEYVDAYGYRIVISRTGYGPNSGWGGVIFNRNTGSRTPSKRIHPSAERAKLAAFDTIELWRRRLLGRTRAPGPRQ